MTTIRDIARACGVAPITVSAVLNNKKGKVSAETRERILSVMREMKYRPGVRRAEVSGRNILGVVSWSDDLWGNFYQGRILAAAGKAAQDRHHHLLLFARYLWYEDLTSSVRTYADGHCEGMMVFPYRHDEPVTAALAERGIPFVVVGDTCSPEDYASVDVDNTAGAFMLVDHLLSLGHRRIAYLGGMPSMRFSTARLKGYIDALSQCGVSPDAGWISHGDLPIEDGYVRAMALLDLPAGQRPTALFCVTDRVAIGALRALNERGVQVPLEMSVAGFDDDPGAERSMPPLTTVRQPYREIGEHAVEILLGQIAGEKSRQLVLPGELVIRASTAPLS